MNAESKSKFTDAIASLTAARDGLNKLSEHAGEEASKAEKNAKSAGRLANVFAVTNAVTDVAVPGAYGLLAKCFTKTNGNK